MNDQHIFGFLIASLCTQSLCLFRVAAYLLQFRHRAATLVSTSGLKFIKQRLTDGMQFPRNEQGRQLQVRMFCLLMLGYFFVNMGQILQMQLECVTSRAELGVHGLGASTLYMVYILIVLFMSLFPWLVNAQYLLAWVALFMALSVMNISPLNIPAEAVRIEAQATGLARFGLTVISPSFTVVALLNVAHYVYAFSRLQILPAGLIIDFISEAIIIIFAGLLVRVFLGTWVNINLELQSHKVETLALRNLLSTLCDAVVELDQDLTICEHSPQLSTLLLQASLGMPSAPSLKGSSLARFLSSDAERDRLEQHLKGEHSSGASAFHTSMIDAMGNQLEVELLHVSFLGFEDERYRLVGIREFQKDTSGLDVDHKIFESSQDERITIVPSSQSPLNIWFPHDVSSHNPMLLFSLDTEKVLRINQEWEHIIGKVESNCPMSHIMCSSSSNYNSFLKVLAIELNSLHHSEDPSDEYRVVSFDNIPLAQFAECGVPLKGEVKLFEEEKKGNMISYGLLSVSLQDVITLKLLQSSSDDYASHVSPRSRSGRSSRSNSTNSRKSHHRRKRSSKGPQPDEGYIFQLRSEALAGPLHL